MIQTKDLKFEYEAEEGEKPKAVLKGINIEINRGEFVSVIGHNGSGKSTLAKHFNVINLPSSGKVYVEKMDTADEALLFEIRRRVGMVFQNPDNQIVATIVEEDVAFAPENLGVEPKEIRRRVDEALKAVGMYENRLSAPHLLSGGQKQRIAIAGILAMQPEYIVLDEPTAMLDPIGRREVMKTIKKLNKELNMTVILITHYMSEAAQADKIFVMRNGEIFMQGAPQDIFAQPEELMKTGLDIPQTTALLHKLKKDGYNVQSNITDIDECVKEILKLL